ncbi:MAG: hypothetical protein OXB84_04325 [Halobacteriovoraceae bacterium]|nr:hypothetical protein [Halobacteriovoraceae bacterium]
MEAFKQVKILDCTLRDGGYYTNWDFEKEVLVQYAQAMNKLPIDFIEIGYRGKSSKEYLGEFYYCNKNTISFIKKHAPNKKISIMIDSKNTINSDINLLFKDINTDIQLVRIASSQENIQNTLELAKELKNIGITVAINIMYASKIDDKSELHNHMDKINNVVDYLYLVDSYGGMLSDDVRNLFKKIKEKLKIGLGFHGHNNLEMAMANSLAALEGGATIIDSTITGMGRGAGNLKTELLLTILKSKNLKDFKYSDLSNVTLTFTNICKKYNWGINYPYMITGAHSLPQKDVMSLLSKRRYSFDTILRFLLTNKSISKDMPDLYKKDKEINEIIIIGGGISVTKHQKALSLFLKSNNKIGVLYSSSKNLNILNTVKNKSYMCLVGDEYGKLNNKSFNINSIDYFLFPSNLMLSDYSFEELNVNKCFKVNTSNTKHKFIDSPLALAIQSCVNMNIKTIYITGFDGYTDGDVKSKEIHEETQKVLDYYNSKYDNIFSLTPSIYKKLKYKSIYSLT